MNDVSTIKLLMRKYSGKWIYSTATILWLFSELYRISDINLIMVRFGMLLHITVISYNAQLKSKLKKLYLMNECRKLNEKLAQTHSYFSFVKVCRSCLFERPEIPLKLILAPLLHYKSGWFEFMNLIINHQQPLLDPLQHTRLHLMK